MFIGVSRSSIIGEGLGGLDHDFDCEIIPILKINRRKKICFVIISAGAYGFEITIIIMIMLFSITSKTYS